MSKTALLRQVLDLFPISAKDNRNVYIRGLKLHTVNTYGELTTVEQFNIIKKEESFGLKLFSKYQELTPNRGDFMLGLDIIRDLVKTGYSIESEKQQLCDIYLHDTNKQAEFISRSFKCLCTTSQLEEMKKSKHIIKARILNIKQS